MNQDRVVGAAKNFGGKVEEGVGRMTGDTSTQAEGLMDQAAGTAQNLYGQAKDAAGVASEVVQKNAKYATDHMRNLVEERPYTVALAALAIGWVIGRVGRND